MSQLGEKDDADAGGLVHHFGTQVEPACATAQFDVEYDSVGVYFVEQLPGFGYCARSEGFKRGGVERAGDNVEQETVVFHDEDGPWRPGGRLSGRGDWMMAHVFTVLDLVLCARGKNCGLRRSGSLTRVGE